jgi:hypothetical protein
MPKSLTISIIQYFNQIEGKPLDMKCFTTDEIGKLQEMISRLNQNGTQLGIKFTLEYIEK